MQLLIHRLLQAWGALLYISSSAFSQVSAHAQRHPTAIVEESYSMDYDMLPAKTEATHLLQLRMNGVVADHSSSELLEAEMENYSLPPQEEPVRQDARLEKKRSIGQTPKADAATEAMFVQLDSHGFHPDDYDWRRELFRRRAAQIAQHNRRPNRLWKAEVNEFTHRTDAELSRLLGWRGVGVASTDSVGEGNPLSFIQIGNLQSTESWGETGSLPTDVSWAHLNATQKFTDQGECGSCWAVTSATVLEAHREIHAPWSQRTYSADELVACVPNPHHCGGTGQCNGATVELAMDYISHFGLAEASETSPSTCPAVRLKGDTARPEILLATGAAPAKETPGLPRESWPGLRKSPAAAGLVGRGGIGMRAWERLPPNTYLPLMHALVERGPAAIATAAADWFAYGEGIFDGCSKDAVIDHAVTLIGYGHDKNLKQSYWHIMNSWGATWGEGGTIRLLRRDNDETEQCGMDTQPEVGNGCEGGPKEVRVCGMCGIFYDVVVPHF
mmetsp:Transcript_72760/g.137582  ORF Transcript_72760/g.137582 Transcript_72760/m.137582 type:complete len:501 (+) Transcript_72760:55-1557(+)